MLFNTALTLGMGLGAGRLVAAQSAPFTVTSFSESVVEIYPTGIAEGSVTSESTIPLACAAGCQAVFGPYYACFINTTLLDGTTISDEFCNDFFCSQGNFTQLENCLNCIIANGDERPLGYYSNTSLTAAPTAEPGSDAARYPARPAWVDLEEANGWLMNVTERCESIDRPVTGATSITASPTTTGPYFIEFSRGDTISYPTWTGLTQYPPPLMTLRIPADQAESQASQTGSATGSSTSSGGGSGSGSPTSSAAAGGSSSPANGAVPGRKGSAGLGLLGMVLAYAVL